jgi:hypothetical protein
LDPRSATHPDPSVADWVRESEQTAQAVGVAFVSTLNLLGCLLLVEYKTLLNGKKWVGI